MNWKKKCKYLYTIYYLFEGHNFYGSYKQLVYLHMYTRVHILHSEWDMDFFLENINHNIVCKNLTIFNEFKVVRSAIIENCYHWDTIEWKITNLCKIFRRDGGHGRHSMHKTFSCFQISIDDHSHHCPFHMG